MSYYALFPDTPRVDVDAIAGNFLRLRVLTPMRLKLIMIGIPDFDGNVSIRSMGIDIGIGIGGITELIADVVTMRSIIVSTHRTLLLSVAER